MKTFKKAFFIAFGSLLMTLGAVTAFFLLFIDNVEVASRFVAFIASIAAVVLGWWMMRRVSESVSEALGWLFIHLWP